MHLKPLLHKLSCVCFSVDFSLKWKKVGNEKEGEIEYEKDGQSNRRKSDEITYRQTNTTKTGKLKYIKQGDISTDRHANRQRKIHTDIHTHINIIKNTYTHTKIHLRTHTHKLTLNDLTVRL